MPATKKNFNPSKGKSGDSIKINGQRLKGKDIRISIGPSVIILKENTNTNQIALNVPKTLIPGKYEARVTIDGHESNSKTFEVVK